MAGKCVTCGTPLSDHEMFCTNCGTECNNNEVMAIFKNAIRSFKEPKRIILLILLPLIWALLMILPRFGIDPVPAKVLAFLTYAKGGLSNSPLEIVGGIIGKGLAAYLFASIIIPLSEKQNPFNSYKRGVSTILSSFKKIATDPSPLIIAAGVALIIGNFLTGDNSPGKSMVLITGVLLSMRSAGNSRGFFGRIYGSFRKSSLQTPGAGSSFSAAAAGMASGFAVGTLISFIPLSFIGYILGAIAIIAGVIIKIVRSSGRRSSV